MMRLNQLAFAGALLALAACSQKDEFQPARPVAEIKGKPIAEAPAPKIVSTQAMVLATATNAAPVASLATNSVLEQIDGYAKVGFEKLASFNFIMPDDVSPTNQPPKDQF